MFFESNPLILSKNLRQSLLIHNAMKNFTKEHSYLMNLYFHLFVQISTHHIKTVPGDDIAHYSFRHIKTSNSMNLHGWAQMCDAQYTWPLVVGT